MMTPQNYERKNQAIRDAFDALKRDNPAALEPGLNLSWSNWGFGLESLPDSAARLQKAGIEFIELHGNHYGPDLGYKVDETLRILGDHGIAVAGVCGMFSPQNDLAGNSGITRQNAIDYLKREIPFCKAVGGSYILVVPGAVGRPTPYDDAEMHRSSETLQLVADLFVEHDIKAAIEPIRSAEVSICHTFADAERYIAMVDHLGVQHINGDIYHMQVEEAHIGEAITAAGERLTNLHVADSNRCALGDGSMDIDTLIMALYLIGYNRPGCYVTPEPLGPGGDPYPAMNGLPDTALLDHLVTQTATYFRQREAAVRKDPT